MIKWKGENGNMHITKLPKIGLKMAKIYLQSAENGNMT